MRTLVVYTSKYGSTKQYAEWIGNELGAECRPAEGVTKENIERSDVVVCGGYLHIGKIVGSQFLINNWDTLSSKRVVFFSVAGAPASDPKRKQWFEDAFSLPMRERIRHVALRGRVRQLDWKDRLLIAFPRTVLKIKYLFTRKPEDLKAIQEFAPFDGVSKDDISAVIAAIKS